MKRTVPSSVVASLVLAGCASSPLGRPSDAVLAEPPPAALAETLPPPPTAEAYWSPGQWKREETGFVWYGGHWVLPRREAVYVQADWARNGDSWFFHPAHWSPTLFKEDAPATVVTATHPPPPHRLESVPCAPGGGYVWIDGHWQPGQDGDEWEPGRWERSRADEQWLPTFWVRRSSRWEYVPGRWSARAFDTTRSSGAVNFYPDAPSIGWTGGSTKN